MPHNPIGASAKGSADGSPAIVVERSRAALTQVQSLEVVVIGAQRLLRVRAVIGVLKEGSRHTPLGDRAQIVD
jgi:hypothetical protein